jgi:hypothetical protein
MKVIQQLIAYFEERGRLSRKQVRELIAKGYWGQTTTVDLRALEGKIGQSFFYEVTGYEHGALWGTDVYTSDSLLATACVHAGLLRPGETGTVKVTMVQPLPVFSGSTRNRVTSGSWTTGWSGAYRVELIRKSAGG